MKGHIHSIETFGTVDGPGVRYVVFTQGCPHHCKGCHNPQTHSFDGGSYIDIDTILEDVKKNPLLRGVTISGGEPFMQAKKIAKLLSKIDRKKLSTIVYTGFLYEDLLNNANENNGYMDLLKQADLLIDGKFEEDKKNLSLKFRGSSNQRILDVQESLKEHKAVSLAI